MSAVKIHVSILYDNELNCKSAGVFWQGLHGGHPKGRKMSALDGLLLAHREIFKKEKAILSPEMKNDGWRAGFAEKFLYSRRGIRYNKYRM